VPERAGGSLTVEQRLALLNNVSISVRPGTLTAIIGPSRAGTPGRAVSDSGLVLA
jgi:ABC-type iron transport system FetAB ATPase subunit